jgi:phosphoglycerate dehydrogenase-like enzyme
MKIVIAEPISDRLNELVRVNNKDWKIYDDRPESTKAFVERIKDADVASSYSVRYSREVFEACPRLKYVAIPAVGASFFVDMEAAQEHGVTVMNCPGYNAQAVAELTVGLSIDVLRHISAETMKLQKGLWSLELPVGRQLSGKSIGLVGYGNVGKAIERLLSTWDVNVRHINSQSNATEVDLLVEPSDVLIICCPITDKTRDLIDGKRINRMKENAIIINVGRGGVVNEDALYIALSSGKIAGAGLDVFVDEPDQAGDSIETVKRFASLPNVVCTPHLAGTTEEARGILGEMIFAILDSCENGAPTNVYVG